MSGQDIDPQRDRGQQQQQQQQHLLQQQQQYAAAAAAAAAAQHQQHQAAAAPPPSGPSAQQQAAATAGQESFFAGWCEAKRYTVQEVIGKGSYGVVCAAIDNATKERVAIKKIQNVFENVADATRILREIKLLRLLKHPDVVEIKHIMLPPDPRNFKDIYVVFELLESDLHTVIGANDDLTQDHHKVFLYQLLRGLNFIHSSGVLHRDLKPKNILANSNCKLKICDFGLARPLLTNDGVSPVHWTDYVATRWYRAPELCGCFYGRYSPAVDIWSIGCIFAEVLLGRPLFPGRDAVSQLQLITDLLGKPSQETIDRIGNQKARAFLNALPAKMPKPFEHKFPNASPPALLLLRRLLSFDPQERPTAAQALADPYFATLPNATEQEPARYNTHHFEFEGRKLRTAEVRELIYQEALMYHPLVAASYLAQQQQQQATVAQGGFPLHHPMGLSAPGSEQAMRHQFNMAAEQQPQQQAHLQQHHAHAAAAASHSTATAATAMVYHDQQQQQGLHPPAAHPMMSDGPGAAQVSEQMHYNQQQQQQQVGQGYAAAGGQQRVYHAAMAGGAQQLQQHVPEAQYSVASNLWHKQAALMQGMPGGHDAMAVLSPDQQAALMQYSAAQKVYQQRTLASMQAQVVHSPQTMGH